MDYLYTGGENAGQTYQRDAAGDTVFCESNGDFILPDYLPEIRKILQVTTDLVPVGKYVGGGRAAFSGNCCHTVTYLDGEGKVASAPLTAPYEVSVPVDSAAAEAGATDSYPVAHSRVENVTVRLSGPRRIALRTVVCSDVHLFVPAEGTQAELPADCGMVTLEKNLPARQVRSATSEDIAIGESLRVEGIPAEQLTVQYTRCEVLIKECKVQDDAVAVKGEVQMRTLLNGQDRRPRLMDSKKTFEETVVVSGADAGQDCLAWGWCAPVVATPVDDGMGGSQLQLDTVLSLEVQTVGEENRRFTVDAFSTEYETETDMTEVPLWRHGGSLMQHITADGSITAEEAGIRGAHNIVDMCGKVTSCEVSLNEEGFAVVSGECKADLLLELSPTLQTLSEDAEEAEPPVNNSTAPAAEHASVSITVPFRAETTLRPPFADCGFRCTARFLPKHGRIDPGKLSVDGEVEFTVLAEKRESLRLPGAYRVNADAPRRRNPAVITVYYPEGNESVWSIARRYGVEPAYIVRRNHLPEADIASPQTLDGMAFLIV